MTSAGIGNNAPRSDSFLVEEIDKLKAQIRELRNGLAVATGFSFAEGKITSPTFDGDLDAPAAGTTGVGLGGPHDALILNTLIAKTAIIDDDALAHPFQFVTAHADATNFPLTTGSFVNKAVANVAVPDGFTQAGVIAFASICARNTTAGLSAFSTAALINGSGGGGNITVQDCAAGASATNGHASAKVLTGLSGSFQVSCAGVTLTANWAADAINSALLNALIVFAR